MRTVPAAMATITASTTMPVTITGSMTMTTITIMTMITATSDDGVSHLAAALG